LNAAWRMAHGARYAAFVIGTGEQLAALHWNGHCALSRSAAATMWRAEIPAASNSSAGVPEPGSVLTAR